MQVEPLVTGNVVAAEISRANPDKGIENKFILRSSPCFIGLPKGESDRQHWLNVFLATRS